MRTIILDLETSGDLSPEMEDQILRDATAEVCAPAGYKDPEKIKAYVEAGIKRAVDSAREKAALSPLTGRIVCATVAVESTDGDDWKVSCIGPDNPGSAMPERELLDRLLTYLAGVDQGCRLVTYNGADFDLPFLALRVMALGIVSPWCIPQRHEYARHLDLMLALGKPGSLSRVCLSVLGTGKGDYTGKDVPESYRNGRFGEIRTYALNEMRLMVDLFTRWRDATGNM
jgi:hypothetical protein